MLVQGLKTNRTINLDFAREWKMMFSEKKVDRDYFIIGKWSDGSPFEMEISERDYHRLYDISLCGPNHAPIPSPPGYKLLRYWGNETEGGGVVRDDVIAWEFDSTGSFHWVFTADNDPTDRDDEHQAILCPNGTVVVPGSNFWENEEQWLKEMQARYAKPEAQSA